MLRRVVHRYTNYEAELREFRLASSKAGALTAVVLVMAGVLLDYGIYPQEQLRFFLARSFIALLIGGIYALLPTPFGRRHVQPLTLAWLILPQMMIAWMIGVTEGLRRSTMPGSTWSSSPWASPCRWGCGRPSASAQSPICSM